MDQWVGGGGCGVVCRGAVYIVDVFCCCGVGADGLVVVTLVVFVVVMIAMVVVVLCFEGPSGALGPCPSPVRVHTLHQIQINKYEDHFSLVHAIRTLSMHLDRDETLTQLLVDSCRTHVRDAGGKQGGAGRQHCRNFDPDRLSRGPRAVQQHQPVSR